ncbi:MAG: DUF1998 domain-containing protein [Opitutales bacterium]|nr:DUF1998 domain-containing protein [Opitutales bacterium]
MSFQPTLRRNQLIAPFGVGAIHVLKGSKAVVTAGLDYWYRGATPQQLQAVKRWEPRLQEKLGVNHFRLPPGPETEMKDQSKLEIPLFRFPTWYVCPRCNRMEQRPLGMDGEARCPDAACNDETMRQVRFAAVCDHGHLQDFPWKEWLRREENPECAGQTCPIYYKAGGSGSLDDISVSCKKCGKKRTLAGIMSAKPADSEASDSVGQRGSTTLSSILLAEMSESETSGSCPEFLCQGGRVWLGEQKSQPGNSCTRPLRAVLINATNVHYAQVESALWIPSSDDGSKLDKLMKLLDRPDIRNHIKMLKTVSLPVGQIAQNLLQNHASDLKGYAETEVVEALGGGSASKDLSWQYGLNDEELIRYPEYRKLQEARQPITAEEDPLEIRTADVDKLPENLREIIGGISLIDKFRETRVYRGFNRLVPQSVDGAPLPESHLWRSPPRQDEEKWLPCSIVYGEGIFIRFNEDRLMVWEKDSALENHIKPLQNREVAAARRMGRPSRMILPRFLLLHTLSHLLIRRLVFECGYGSASLRERLYVSDNPKSRMAGILIYTASGDSEGSMGGLVRMGEPEHFSRILQGAIEDANWCSADPVCTESGINGGQGIDGLNIAACHCCALLPETSCEHFNSFLDRSIVASRSKNNMLGFFA